MAMDPNRSQDRGLNVEVDTGYGLLKSWLSHAVYPVGQDSEKGV